MNKTSDLLNGKYRNQNKLTQNFMKTSFFNVVDSLIKLNIENSPFVNILNKFQCLNLLIYYILQERVKD